MIRSFKSKPLERFFTQGNGAKLPQERLEKIKNILAAIHAATDIRDLNNPAFRLHQLKKPPYEGYWSIDVTGNYRIIFRFSRGDASDVDYLDTH
jgi:proteic killer suppression protein